MADVIVGVGGTGQHILLAALRLKELGALPPQIEAVAFDPDREGALSHRLLTANNTVRDPKSHPLALHRVIAPFDATALGEKGFSEVFVDPDHDKERALFEGFFTEDEGRIPVQKGMFGTPAVGATVISTGIESKEIQDAIASLSKATRIYLCGSVVGGTGAGITHKLAMHLKAAEKPIHAVFLTKWFDVPPGGTVSPQTILRNQRHGVQYVFDHTLAHVDNAMIIGFPSAAKGSGVVQLGHADNVETPSYLMLVAGRAILELEQQHRLQAGTKAWGFAHDDRQDEWLLDTKWWGDRTLRYRYHVATALENLLALIVQNEANIASVCRPGFLGTMFRSPDSITKGLYTSIQNHAPREDAPARAFIAALSARWDSQRRRLGFCREWLETIYGKSSTLGRGSVFNQRLSALDVEGAGSAGKWAILREWLDPRAVGVGATGKLAAEDLADQITHILRERVELAVQES